MRQVPYTRSGSDLRALRWLLRDMACFGVRWRIDAISAYAQRHVHTRTIRAGRFFGGRQSSARASEPMEVGDLSRWESERSRAILDILPDNGGGQ
jgi:hypothetical protein